MLLKLNIMFESNLHADSRARGDEARWIEQDKAARFDDDDDTMTIRVMVIITMVITIMKIIVALMIMTMTMMMTMMFMFMVMMMIMVLADNTYRRLTQEHDIITFSKQTTNRQEEAQRIMAAAKTLVPMRMVSAAEMLQVEETSY